MICQCVWLFFPDKERILLKQIAIYLRGWGGGGCHPNGTDVYLTSTVYHERPAGYFLVHVPEAILTIK